MTLLVALRGRNGIVAAADSRGTFGDPRGVTAQNDSQRKVHLVSPHVAILTAGQGELGAQLIAEIGTRVSTANVDGATNVLELARQTARTRYQEWFPHLPAAAIPGTPQMARPDVAFLVAGYDVGAGGAFSEAKLYQSMSSLDFPPMLHNYGFALAGVAQYALYLLNRLYQPDRSLEELTALAVYVITETASQDGKVGGPVRVATIQPDAGGRELSDDAVRAIHETNENRGGALRQSFYTGEEQER